MIVNGLNTVNWPLPLFSVLLLPMTVLKCCDTICRSTGWMGEHASTVIVYWTDRSTMSLRVCTQIATMYMHRVLVIIVIVYTTMKPFKTPFDTCWQTSNKDWRIYCMLATYIMELLFLLISPRSRNSYIC